MHCKWCFLLIEVLRNYNKACCCRWTASKRILCSEKLQRSLKRGGRPAFLEEEKNMIRPCSKIASGRLTGSSTFGTTASLEMNKRSSQSYQWRFLIMSFLRVSNNLADWDLFQTSQNLKRSCVSAASRDRYARQPWNSEEGSAVPGDKCFGFTKMFINKILANFESLL